MYGAKYIVCRCSRTRDHRIAKGGDERSHGSFGRIIERFLVGEMYGELRGKRRKVGDPVYRDTEASTRTNFMIDDYFVDQHIQ